jgi:V8-like Glu-specific endopeptidase
MRSIKLTLLLIASTLWACNPDASDITSDAPATSASPAVELGTQSYAVRHGVDDGDQNPSIVKLIMRVGSSYYLCSGSVIAEDVVLTAAHCVDEVVIPFDVRIIYGQESLNAAEVIIHENYSTAAPHIRYTEGNYYRFSSADIALLKFDEMIPLPTLPIGNPPEVRGELMTVVGYGNNENLSSGVRRNGQVEFIATSATYLSNKETVDLSDGSILIDPGPTNQTVCGGDSGGALIYQDRLVGVTSGGVINYGDGNQCVRSRNANFISAPAHLSWIQSHVTMPEIDTPEPEDPKEENPEPEDPEEENPEPEDPEEENPEPEDPEGDNSDPEGDTDRVGEYGQLSLTSEWTTVQLAGSYIEPIILISDPQSSHLITTARLRNVGSSSFEARLQSPNYLETTQESLQASYIVVESGDWVLEGGARLSAGRVASAKLSRQGWSRVHLQHFAETPAILTQIQTYADQDWVVTRIRRQSAQSFDVTMQEEEALNIGSHAQELIGWVAISQGTIQGSGQLWEAQTSGRSYSHHVARVDFSNTLESPTVIAKLGSTFGGDTAHARIINADESGFDVQVAEEQSQDQETRHTTEMISFFAFAGSTGSITADPWQDAPRDPLGEYGQVTVNGAWQTVMLQGQYQAPVVVFSEPGSQGLTPVATRIRGVGAQSFQVRLEGIDVAPENITSEVMSFIVMESGDWITRNGARIVAGTRNSNKLSRQGWESVSFAHFTQTPVVLTQIQTSNEEGWTVTRVRRQNRTRFHFTMQESELNNRGIHAEESVGYIAITAGDHGPSGQRLLGVNTARSYNHTVRGVQFDQTFESAPSVIAKLGSTYGGDSANLRLSDIGMEGFAVQVAEEQSRDSELNHIAEQVSYIALDSTSGVID